MISKFNEIERLFIEIDKLLKRKIEVYMIGGAVLLYQSLKPATKDIDIILKNKGDFIEFQQALIKAGFGKKQSDISYKNLDLTYLLIRNDFRVDLFLSKVCSKFSLSEGMMKRANNILNLKNISLFNCSNEDIFLFKTMTDRQGDLEDCIALAKMGLDWQTMKQELINQIKLSGRDIWITWIGERLDLLIDSGLNIPIIKDLDKLRMDYYNSIDTLDDEDKKIN